MNKLVSVIIPTYGEGQYLNRCVDSVLAQTYQNIEVIVVDDNGLGTPNQLLTQKVMEEYKDEPRVKYICHEVNKNGSAARNTGFSLSKGDYISLLDDDDEYSSDKIARQVEALEQHPECGLTYCSRKMFVGGKPTSLKRALPSDDWLFDLVTHRRGISSGTLMVRREIWLRLGGFDESFWRHQDYEFTARVATVTQIMPVDFVGLIKDMVYRNSTKNVSQLFGYRKQYMATVLPLISSYSKQQKQEVVEANYLSLAMKALLKGDIKNWAAIYRYVKPGLWGYTYMFRYVIKTIRNRNDK